MRGSIVKRGKKYSIVIYLGRGEDGKKKQKWYSGFNTKKEAETELGKILGEISSGTYIPPKNLTVKQYMDNWLETYALPNLKTTTYTTYEMNVRRHINPYLGKTELQKLNPLQIQSFYDYLLKNGRVDGKGGLAGKTIVQIHRILAKAFKQAYRLQLLNKIPTDFVDPPKKKKYKPTILKEEDIPRLLNAFRDTDLYMPVLLGINLGLRRGEVLGLRWQDIDFIKRIITINQTLVGVKGAKFTTPKSESSHRAILISDGLIKELSDHQAKQNKMKEFLGKGYNHKDDLVCCRIDGSIIHPGTLNNLFNRRLEKFKIDHIRFHDLRHTNATMMLKGKIPAKVASQRLGHSTIGVTLDIYSHVMNDMQEEASEYLERKIKELIDD